MSTWHHMVRLHAIDPDYQRLFAHETVTKIETMRQVKVQRSCFCSDSTGFLFGTIVVEKVVPQNWARLDSMRRKALFAAL